MCAERRPVLVGINDSPGSDAALRWALADARTRGGPVRLVYAYRWQLPYGRIPVYADIPDAELHQPLKVAEQVVARQIDLAREIDDQVEVTGDTLDGDAARVLVEESAHAAVLVVGSRQLKSFGSAVLGSVSASAAARAACPAVVVRGPAGLAEEGAAVVVGVDGKEASERLLEFGFDYASRHHVALRPVLCWHPDLLATMSWRPEPPAPTQVEVWLSELLAGWREKYPDVPVHPEVRREHALEGLVFASRSQHLLVVGSHGHHAVTGSLLGSVSQGVLHHATCPVAVVPMHSH